MTSDFIRGFDSLCIKDDASYAPGSHTMPIFQTSTFIYESAHKAMEVFRGNEKAFIYSRWNNPNVDWIEHKLCALEAFQLNIKVKGLAFSTGMAAISALIECSLKQGDTLIAQGNLYGTTIELLYHLRDQRGIELVFIDMCDLELVEQTIASHPTTKLIYLESPSNPALAVCDIKQIAQIAKSHNIACAIDNTFATPWLQQPFIFGVDHVVHSTTKYLNGHGTALGGFLCSTHTDFIQNTVWKHRKISGAMLAPMDAWLLNNGVKTLRLRMEQHCKNAMQVAQFLETHSAVQRVFYPGLPSHAQHQLAKKQMRNFGGVLAFELKGGMDAGIRLMNRVQLCTLTASIGTADTLIQHPAGMTHYQVAKAQREAYGITDGLIRLSVGLEDANDIIDDLENALK